MITQIANRSKELIQEGGVSHLSRTVCLKVLHAVVPSFTENMKTSYDFYKIHNYWPNFTKPRTFNEKMIYRMRSKPLPLWGVVADKWAVREYVAEKVGKEVLNKVLWLGDNPEEIPFDQLPDKFVIKATHGSGWNIIVPKKGELDQVAVIEKCKKWINTKYSQYWGESHYDLVPPRILIEEYLDGGAYSVPWDYKFMCFDGVVHNIGVDVDRFGKHSRLIYDQKWHELPFEFHYPRANVSIPKPECLDQMIEIAQKLSVGFDYCRVDLYFLQNKRIIFGEITIAPGAGQHPILPKEWDFKLGELWSMQKI